MNTKRKTLKMPVRYLMNAVLVALLFVGLSFLTQNVLSTYQNKVLLTVGINIILAVSLNVATGYLGQLPLGHAGFMAVGAYTCALFTKYGAGVRRGGPVRRAHRPPGSAPDRRLPRHPDAGLRRDHPHHPEQHR